MVSWDGVFQTADRELTGFSPVVVGVAAVAILRDANPNERHGSPDCAVPASLSRKLVRCFVLGVPAYRLRFKVTLAPSTVLRIYRWIWEAIYANSLQEWTFLGGLVEADQTIFGGRRAQLSEDGGQLER
jgi:hypothetical protein